MQVMKYKLTITRNIYDMNLPLIIHFYNETEKNRNSGKLCFKFTINVIEMKNSVY